MKIVITMSPKDIEKVIQNHYKNSVAIIEKMEFKAKRNYALGTPEFDCLEVSIEIPELNI